MVSLNKKKEVILMRFVDILQQYAYGLLEENTHFLATLGECHIIHQNNELFEILADGKLLPLSEQMLNRDFLNRTFVKKVDATT